MTVSRFRRIEDLTDPNCLASLIGPIVSVERAPLVTLGYSAARHERLCLRLGSGGDRSFVLKRIWPRLDWTSYRTGDARGREALLLEEPSLQTIWRIFYCPYWAYAVEEDAIGLLMEDLADSLPPLESPLTGQWEDALLAHLAALHASFWMTGEGGGDPLGLPWLTSLSRRFSILGPGVRDEERDSPHPLFPLVRRGWEIALERLPSPAREVVLRSPEEIARACHDLPLTLLHGDTKIDNFAFLAGGRVAAFDWAVMGVGPPTLDIGYHLAVNWQRLPYSKETILSRYRRFLEQELDAALPESLWERLVAAAVLAGSLKLLWSKALACESGVPGAEAEWSWWVDGLVAQAL